MTQPVRDTVRGGSGLRIAFGDAEIRGIHQGLR